MSASPHDHRRVLATGEQCQVEECSCGTLHLTIGALTLRLTPGTAADLADTLGAGIRALAARHGVHANAHRVHAVS